ncbi:MAG: LysR family transcriptional regulator [Clostridia bacterium]|nr:LysR family transcriptional regulator [Clostridia bacterium]
MHRQMRYFIAVVENGSFFEAGEACHISQSAISQQIKALESELQVTLLERHGRKFTVTPAGQYFYAQAKRQVASLDVLIREVRRIDSDEYQSLRVGVLNGFSPRIMRLAIQEFTRNHPHVRLFLTTGTHEELFHGQHDGRLDMAVNDQWRKLSEQAINEELADQPLFAMLRQDHPLAAAPVAALEALKDWMCILVTPEEQRENEVVHWRDYFGLQSDFLFVENVETACMDAASGAGFYLCDGDMPCPEGTVLLPLTRGGAPMTRKMFAFWPESRDSSLQWEFTQALHTVIK